MAGSMNFSSRGAQRGELASARFPATGRHVGGLVPVQKGSGHVQIINLCQADF